MVNRLLELVNELSGGKKTVFAKNAGIPKGTFYGYLKGGVPHVDHLVRIQETYSICIDWILTGRGPKYITDQGKTNTLDPAQGITDPVKGPPREAIRLNDRAAWANKRLNVADRRINRTEDDLEIVELLKGAQRVLTSGNPVAYDALKGDIRYFDQAIAAEKKMNRMEDDLDFIKKELAKQKLENQRLDTEEEAPSSKKQAG